MLSPALWEPPSQEDDLPFDACRKGNELRIPHSGHPQGALEGERQVETENREPWSQAVSSATANSCSGRSKSSEKSPRLGHRWFALVTPTNRLSEPLFPALGLVTISAEPLRGCDSEVRRPQVFHEL